MSKTCSLKIPKKRKPKKPEVNYKQAFELACNKIDSIIGKPASTKTWQEYFLKDSL